MVCIPTTVSLSASGANNYLWSNGDTSSTIDITPNGNTTFTVQGTNTYGCTSTESVFITTQPSPISDFIASDTIVNLNPGIVTFSNISQNGSSYYWDFGDGNNATGTAPWNQYLSSGVYSVMLITSNNNCPSDTLIKPNYIQIIDNVGISETQLPEFNIFLQKNSGVISINSSINSTYSLTITATNGSICGSYKLTGSLNHIDISGFSEGIYLFTFTTGANKQTVKIKL